ncbi:hypothetical protein E9993_14705 [Labilibacter sediminis]|nr:hypothetical protein E9993_14705 [Labilibacter sediminis]
MTAKKNNAPAMTAEQMQKVIKQNETLLKRIEELEKTNEKKPKTYEEQIQFIQDQQQIIKHLNTFETKKVAIEDAVQQVKDKTENGDFEAKVFALSLTSTNGEKKTVFNITNPLIIGKVLESVSVEVTSKIESLKEALTL